MAQLAAVCGTASLCVVAGATKVTPCLVQGVNIAFLVQADGHAAAKPGGNAGRSPSDKGRCFQQDDEYAGNSGKDKRVNP
ncbi:hypothetical protein EID71_17245 [Salmonella enterica subsp. indica serovar 11:b:e,n,x]|nr:hypothetical protein [Salmonella enterica subsp. indica serovar 11:b:e,n,x]